MADEPERITPVEARGGLRMPVIRRVLIVSVILAVIAMVWAFMSAPEATQPDTSTTMATPPAS